MWGGGQGPLFADAGTVRRAVFVAEQGFSAEGEFDALDEAAQHLVGYVGEEPACAGRLYFDAAGDVNGIIVELAVEDGKFVEKGPVK